MSRPAGMVATPSSSSLFASRSNSGFSPASTPQTSKSTGPRPRKSNALEFGTPIKVESSSPYRTPDSSSKTTSFLTKSPFGTPNRSTTSAPFPSTQASTFQSGSTAASSQPLKPLTGRAQLTARIRSLWFGEGEATSTLQARNFLPYSGFAKLMLQTNLDRLYLFSFLAIHLFLSISLFSPLHPLTSITLPFRPLLFFISFSAFTLSTLPLILLRRWSITDARLAMNSSKDTTGDLAVAGKTLRFGSPAAHYFSAMCQAKTGLLISLYALSGLFLASSHALGLMLYSSDSSTWTPYQPVSFRNPQGLRVTSFRPNERLFFLLGSNFFVGALYILHQTLTLSPCNASPLLSSPTFEPQATVESLGGRLSSKSRRRLPRAFLVGSALPGMLLVFYLSIRRPLFRLILSVIGHNSALRPVLIPSFRHYFLTPGLVFRSIGLGIVSTLTWESIAILWEVFSTQPFSNLSGGLSRFSREPTKCLIEGMQSRRTARENEGNLGPVERNYYAHFAFAEMALVAATDVDRRKAIFREVGSINANMVEGGSKSAWVAIAQECIKVLEEERECVTLRGRSKMVARPTAVPSQSASRLKAMDSGHKAIVEEGQNVFKKGQTSVWDRLASGPAAPALPPIPSKSLPAQTAAPGSSAGDGLGSLLHRLAPTPEYTNKPGPGLNAGAKPATSKEPAPSLSSAFASFILSSTANVFKALYLLLPHDLRHVLSRLPLLRSAPLTTKRLLTPTSQTLLYTGTVPRHAALTTWSIQTLSALLSATVDQDEYGTVALSSNQKLGVDDVLEEIATLLIGLSQWGQEIAREMQGESEVKKQDLTMLWDRRVAPIVIASRTAINLVLGVFEPTGFQLRPSTQSKVNEAMAAG